MLFSLGRDSLLPKTYDHVYIILGNLLTLKLTTHADHNTKLFNTLNSILFASGQLARKRNDRAS
jgi:hypothetical protein